MSLPFPSQDDSASGRRQATVVGALRTLMTLGAIPLCLLFGLVVLLFSGDRQRASNRMIGLWAHLASKIAGLRIVVENESYIEQARPAVFIFNHQSAADILIICAVLRSDFAPVAKREIRAHPILGPAFAFAGAVFVDRFNHEQAIRALQPAIDTLRRGVSIAIAPEGTRSVDGRLGQFKKGAFRLAMAAKVPIVPVVIRNASEAVPPRGIFLRPATVRVIVRPPIRTEDWTRDDLDAKIAEVRAVFQDTSH